MAASPLAPTSAPVPAPEPTQLSEGARIINTFIAPSKTFTDLRRNASWWAPWLLISVFGLIFVYSMQRQVGFDQISRNEIANSPRAAEQFDKLSPADQQKRLEFSDALVKYLAYASPITTLFFFLIITVVLWATVKVVAGSDISFKTAYAIVFYAKLPEIVGAILGTASMFAGINPEGFNVNNPVATNPAYFMDRGGSKFLYVLASGLDVVQIWCIILMGIGFACSSKIKRSTAIGIVAGWYVFWKLAMAALAAR
jgi:hypothetical protein